MAHGGDPDRVGVLRVNDDARDVVGIGQAHELPGGAAVDRFEEALARIRGACIGLLAGADPDDLRVRWRDRDGSDRRHFDRVGDDLPTGPAVDGLPQTTRPRRRVDRIEMLPRRAVGHSDLGDPGARPERADVAERQPIEHRLQRAGRRLLGGDVGSDGERPRQGEGGGENRDPDGHG